MDNEDIKKDAKRILILLVAGSILHFVGLGLLISQDIVKGSSHTSQSLWMTFNWLYTIFCDWRVI